jgi:hypothetical protein
MLRRIGRSGARAAQRGDPRGAAASSLRGCTTKFTWGMALVLAQRKQTPPKLAANHPWRRYPKQRPMAGPASLAAAPGAQPRPRATAERQGDISIFGLTPFPAPLRHQRNCSTLPHMDRTLGLGALVAVLLAALTFRLVFEADPCLATANLRQAGDGR